MHARNSCRGAVPGHAHVYVRRHRGGCGSAEATVVRAACGRGGDSCGGTLHGRVHMQRRSYVKAQARAHLRHGCGEGCSGIGGSSSGCEATTAQMSHRSSSLRMPPVCELRQRAVRCGVAPPRSREFWRLLEAHVTATVAAACNVGGAPARTTTGWRCQSMSGRDSSGGEACRTQASTSAAAGAAAAPISPRQLTARIKACVHEWELGQLLDEHGGTFNEVQSGVGLCGLPSACRACCRHHACCQTPCVLPILCNLATALHAADPPYAAKREACFRRSVRCRHNACCQLHACC
eukprot:119607-Chlamydomonas_euryale.AAC.4